MNTCELANDYAINQFISDLGDNNHSQFYDTLRNGSIPKDVIIWQPFEDCTPNQLFDLIENLTLSYIHFHEQANKEAQKCMS